MLGFPSAIEAAPVIPTTLATQLTVAPVVTPGRTVDRALELPWNANMIGVTFTGAGAAVEIEARVRRDGVWSEPVELDSDSEDLPDGAEGVRASKRRATDPFWIGEADAVRLRVAVARGAAIRDVRLELINTNGDAHPPTLLGRVGRALRTFFSLRAVPAHAIPRTPAVISRARWGANESWRDSAPRYAPDVQMVFLHHTDSSNSYTKSQSAAVVRGIYRYHVFSRDFSDIGYNFLVDRYGQVFEGRAGGITRPVIGAHTLGFNSRSTGIAVLGRHTSAAPTSATLRALRDLIAWKMDVHHLPPTGKVVMTSGGNERYPAGTRVTFYRIAGHRNAKPTACPGATLYSKLSWLRSAANGIGHPKIYLPRASTSIVRPDADGVNESVRILASFSRSVRWTLALSDARGTVRRRVLGSGTWAGFTWAGRDDAGALLPSGLYRWRLEARDSAGSVARPATGALYLVTTHADGTLLRDGTGRYTLAAGQRIDLNDPVVTTSHFGTLAPIATGPGERARTVASPVSLPLRDGTLLRDSSTDARYIWSGGTLRPFASAEIFASLAYSSGALLSVAPEYIAGLPAGPPVDDADAHPPGTVVRDGSGQLFVIGAASRSGISWLAFRSRYRSTELVTATQADLELPVEPAAVPVRTGAVIRATDGGAPWLVENGTRRRFISTWFFSALGYTTPMLLPATSAELAALPVGPTYG